MRVIAGICKGRPLKAVPGNKTRPTTDQVKETIFNIIGPFFEGGQALDLYGGSGSLGIEALSRGVEKAIFVDRYGPAVGIIKKNLETCKFQERAEVYRIEAARALKVLSKSNQRFDLVFLDPPYAEARLEKDLTWIVDHDLVSPDGVIVVEHDVSKRLPEQLSTSITLWKHQTAHEQTALSFYRREKNT